MTHLLLYFKRCGMRARIIIKISGVKMKIFFNTLAPLKKEVVKLRNTHKKIFNEKINLQKAQDLLARMYGWQNYNDMGRSHTDMFSMKNINLLNNNELIKHDIYFINNIDVDNKMRLEINKRSVLLSYLDKIDNKNNDKEELFLKEFFNRKSFIQKFFEKNKTKTIDSLFEIPQNTWRYNTTIYGCDKKRLSEIYSGVPVLNALSRGGFFILRESVAMNTFKTIADSLPPEEQHRLKVIDLNNSFTPNDYHRSIDLKKDESIDTIFSYIEGMVYNQGQNDIMRGNALIFLSVYKIALKHIYGKGEGALNNINLKELMTTEKAMRIAFKELCHVKDVEPLREFLRHLPGLDEHKFLNYNQIDEMTYAQFGFVIMHFTTIVCNIDSFHHNKMESFRLSDAVDSKDIIIIVFNEHQGYQNTIQGILSIYRKSLVPMLGVCIDGTPANPMRKRVKTNRFKPIVLDCMELYMIRGFSVVMASCRQLGYAFFSNVSDIDRAKSHCPEEYASSIANTRNKIIVKGVYPTCEAFDISERVSTGAEAIEQLNKLPIKDVDEGKIVYCQHTHYSCMPNESPSMEYLIVN